MTSRERVRAVLSHQIPDRVPVDLSGRSSAIESGAYRDLRAYLGIDVDRPEENFIRSHAVTSEEILRLLHVDTRYVRSVPPESWQTRGEDSFFVDQWGVPWRRPAGGNYYDIDRFLLEDVDPEAFDAIPWHPLATDAMAEEMRREADRLYRETDCALFTDVLGSAIFESAWYLRGFEQFMVDLLVEEEFSAKFLRKILDLQFEAYEKLLAGTEGKLEGVFLTDDLASQDSLLLSPETYRNCIMPYQKELFSFLHSKGVEVLYHSCGAILPLLPDLIEAGVRVLHPVQLSAAGMDPDVLKREYGDRLVLFGGGCNSQTTLQFGTPQEVRDEVRFRLEKLMPGGGYLFAPEHCIQNGTPPQNIVAMFETVHEYGVY